ncbi:MAG TPA: GDSL-type esterase/lipase family protein, partial [Bacteroidales bacterium]|nr:GDSL-type esterase/lipase family protein [Bacteroidales bacterium]
AGKTATIKWENFGNNQTILDYSTDNGSSWQNIDTVHMLQQYNWQIPNTPSQKCLVRIKADTLEDESKDTFEISQDSSSCKIVVIGSSTAAGAGASVSDSAWVSRFRTRLCEKDTRYEVENLARGGYTTYHLLPTGTSISGSVGVSIDTSRNVTKALSMNPSGIIVNLPSNDAAYGFSVQQQLENFTLIEQEAASNGVYTWICTTQPRYFTNPSIVQIQQDVRDSILAIYGPQAIDFWTGLADTNGFIRPKYDSGDGVHVNDKGHRLLFEKVMAKQPDTLCDNPTTFIPENKSKNTADVVMYPNPFNKNLTVEFNTTSKGQIHMTLYDLTGRKIHSKTKSLNSSGRHKLILQPELYDGLSKQFVIASILITDESGIYSRVFKLIRDQ